MHAAGYKGIFSHGLIGSASAAVIQQKGKGSRVMVSLAGLWTLEVLGATVERRKCRDMSSLSVRYLEWIEALL